MEQIKPEELLCILFSRLKLNEQELTDIQNILRANINWDYFYNLSEHHRITSLIYHHVKNRCLEKLFKSKNLKKFRTVYKNHEIRNKDLFRDLKLLFKKLAEEKIKAVPLKGASLIPMIYKIPQIRPMSDSDILIERKYLKQTERILNKVNYSREDALRKIFNKPVHNWERYKELHDSGHIGFFKIKDLPYKKYACIEIHISLFKRANMIFDDLTGIFLNGR